MNEGSIFFDSVYAAAGLLEAALAGMTLFDVGPWGPFRQLIPRSSRLLIGTLWISSALLFGTGIAVRFLASFAAIPAVGVLLLFALSYRRAQEEIRASSPSGHDPK